MSAPVTLRWGREDPSYAFAVRIVEGLELDDIRVAHDAHNLKLTVLPRSAHPTHLEFQAATYLEPLVLEDTLDGSILPGR